MSPIKSFFRQELSLENTYFIAIKSGIACALAFAIDLIVGNKDHISSTFVAVPCVFLFPKIVKFFTLP